MPAPSLLNKSIQFQEPFRRFRTDTEKRQSQTNLVATVGEKVTHIMGSGHRIQAMQSFAMGATDRPASNLNMVRPE